MWEELEKMFPEMFNGGQEDPHELLQLWLDYMHQNCAEDTLPMKKIVFGRKI